MQPRVERVRGSIRYDFRGRRDGVRPCSRPRDRHRFHPRTAEAKLGTIWPSARGACAPSREPAARLPELRAQPARAGLPRWVPGSPTAGTRFETPPKSRMLRHGCGPARRTGRRRNRARARSSTGDVAAYSARPERARMEHRSAAELGCPSASPMSTEPPWSPTPGQTTDRSARFRAWLRQARAAQKSWSMYPSSNSANLPLSEMGSPSGPITTRPTC
jgi:hypothetical protein